MKTFAHFLVAATLIFCSHVAVAQSSATAQLNNIIDLADDIDANADASQDAAKTLRVDYFSPATPNLSTFNAQISSFQISGMTSFVDDIIFSAQQAKIAQPSLNITNILNYANQVKMLRDEILDQALDLNDAIPIGDTNGVLSSVKILRKSAKEQSALAKEIAAEASSML